MEAAEQAPGVTGPLRQAVLCAPRIRLVPLADEHLEHEVELDSDPEVLRYLGNGRARDRDEVADLHRHRLAVAGRVPGLGFWAGFVGEAFVGWWILEPSERDDHGLVEGEAELGYRLLRSFWRRGLAGEAARELLRHGFQNLGLTRVFARTMAVSTASRATMAAIGMHHVRTFGADADEPPPGSEWGEVEYEITRPQWLAGRSGSPAGGPRRSITPSSSALRTLVGGPRPADPDRVARLVRVTVDVGASG